MPHCPTLYTEKATGIPPPMYAQCMFAPLKTNKSLQNTFYWALLVVPIFEAIQKRKKLHLRLLQQQQQRRRQFCKIT